MSVLGKRTSFPFCSQHRDLHEGRSTVRAHLFSVAKEVREWIDEGRF